MIKRRALPGLVIVVLAVAVSVFSLVVWWSGRTVAASTATLGGLQVRVDDAQWMRMEAHSMDGGSGYAMPAQMMPGAPADGLTRLGVPITLSNHDSGWRSFSISAELFLTGTGIATPLAVQSDTIGGLPRLAPGTAVDGVLYFDISVPPGGARYALLWRRDGREERLALRIAPNAAATPTHHH